nr:MAG TPA: hypothetical protein [Caudoviricetes sp.]
MAILFQECCCPLKLSRRSLLKLKRESAHFCLSLHNSQCFFREC